MLEMNKIYQGDSLAILKKMPDASIDCCVTSPPYYGLRDYGAKAQIGLEETPELFIIKLVQVFQEVNRVLKPDGTLWVNMGDTYAAYWGQKYGQGQSLSGSRENNGSAPPAKKSPVFSKSKRDTKRYGGGNIPAYGCVKPKDLFGIPWMLAFALRDYGWYLRQDIIWYKPNPMPESVSDRCTKSHEYIFLLSKSPRYYYDADSIKTDVKDATIARMSQQINDKIEHVRVVGKTNSSVKEFGPGRKPRKGVDHKGGNQGSENGIPAMAINGNGVRGHSGYFGADGELIGGGKANKKSVWQVTTKPFSEAHFATFPEDLIVDCIKAGCRGGGTVLDPFMGAGTTALVARKLNRNFIGIELNPQYIQIAERRLEKELGLFK